MSVVVETTLGDITIDLFVKQRPRACLNFLKLCKMKYYNYNLFHTIRRDFIAQTGDPTGSRNGGESIFGVLEGPLKRYFEAEKNPRIKHTTVGLISFVGIEDNMIGSQFFLTLGTELTYLDDQHCVFGEVMEGLDVLELLNDVICDQDNRPYQDVRITHTVILDDPFPDPETMKVPSRSPSPSAERLQGGRIAPDEDIDETKGRSIQEVVEIIADKEAKARATILEMIGDIPDAEMAPPENVLFVCKLNPVTTDDDLEIIFSRFGKIKSCEIIRDKKTAESLQYAFVEFFERKSCEDAYFKMDNVLIDDRRIHVDFSQSVAKVKWHGKGRGVTTYDDAGRRTKDGRNDIGNGRYKVVNKSKDQNRDLTSKDERSSQKRRSPEKDYYHERHDKELSSRLKRDRNNRRSPRRSDDRDTKHRDSYRESRSNKHTRDYSEIYKHNDSKERYRYKRMDLSENRNDSSNYRYNDFRPSRSQNEKRRNTKHNYDSSSDGEKNKRREIKRSIQEKKRRKSTSKESSVSEKDEKLDRHRRDVSNQNDSENRKKNKHKRREKSVVNNEDDGIRRKKIKKERCNDNSDDD